MSKYNKYNNVEQNLSGIGSFSIEQLCNQIRVKSRSKNLNFSLSELYKTVYCPCRSKNSDKSLKRRQRLYSSCEPEINEYLNIESLIRRMREISFLKYLFLNKEQILSFEYFEKPEISMTESTIGKKRFSLISSQQLTLPPEAKMEKVISHFKAIGIEDNKDALEINNKIYSLLHEEIKSAIKSK